MWVKWWILKLWPSAGFYVLRGGEASPPKKNFPKKIKIYFKYWSYLTKILRNQWRLPVFRNVISANPAPEHYLFKILQGSMSLDPLEGPKSFFWHRVTPKNFLGSTSPPQQKILHRTLICLNSSLMCTYICKDLVTGYFLYLVKKMDSQPSPLFKLILLPTPCFYGLDITKFVCRFEDCIAPQLTFDDKNLEARFTNKFLCMSFLT